MKSQSSGAGRAAARSGGMSLRKVRQLRLQTPVLPCPPEGRPDMPKECQGLAVQTPRGPDAHVVDDVSDFDDFESASGQGSALLSARSVSVGGERTALKQSKGGGGVRSVRNMFAFASQPATQSTQGGKPKGGSRRRGEAGGSVQSSQAIRGSRAPPLRQRMGTLPCVESTAQKQTTTSVDEIADFSDDEMVGAPTPCTIMSTGEDGSKKDFYWSKAKRGA